MTTEFVKVTTRDFVKVFSVHDVKANGIEYAPSKWTVCRTRKAFREMIETYSDSDSTYSTKKRAFIHHNRHLIDDCTLWIGNDGNNGEYFEENDALPKSKTNGAFEYGYLSTGYDLATYGDAFHLAYTSDDPDITYVRDNDEFYDDEITLTIDEIPEYTEPTEPTQKEESETMSERTFELPCLDSRKSFYGKAHVIERSNGEKLLKSYDTIVCKIDAQGIFKRLWEGYSATTQRHVNSFICYYGIKNNGGKSAWDKMEVISA